MLVPEETGHQNHSGKIKPTKHRDKQKSEKKQKHGAMRKKSQLQGTLDPEPLRNRIQLIF